MQELQAVLLHDVRLLIEALFGAGFLIFCWFMAPLVRGGK